MPYEVERPMQLIEILGKNDESGRQVEVLFLPKLEDLPLPLTLSGQYFGLFLACDAAQIPDHHLIEVARSLIKEGMVYLCSWGADCERVHDLFDSAIVENDPDETDKSVKMTTWLNNMSLDEAAWHFLNVAFPADEYWDGCKTELFIVVGNQEWASQIRMRIVDQGGLNKAVLVVEA